MLYEFRHEDTGEIAEFDFPMKTAPRIGDVVRRKTGRWRRIASGVQVDSGNHRQYPYVSNALPRNHAGCKLTHQGKPIVESRRHERNLMSRFGYARD